MATEQRSGRRALVRELVDAFDRNDLLLFASAMSFQVLTAVVPVLLFVLGLLGLLELTEVWRSDVRPSIAESVSPAAMKVIDDTVTRVLGSKQVFWITAGAALAVWQVSGGVRAAMDVLNRVHGVQEDRPWRARHVRSLWLAAVLIALIIAAAAVVNLTPLLYGDPGPALGVLLLLARWAAAAALLALAVGLLVHRGPDFEQPLSWVSVGTLLVIGAWVVMSAAFLAYLTHVASYGSLFGNLATVVVLMAYVYASTITFLVGIQVDALLRDRAG